MLISLLALVTLVLRRLMNPHMTSQQHFRNEYIVAHSTLIRLFTNFTQNMVSQLTPSNESFCTENTFKRFVNRVFIFMLSQIACIWKSHSTFPTFVYHFSCVMSHLSIYFRSRCKLFRTKPTNHHFSPMCLCTWSRWSLLLLLVLWQNTQSIQFVKEYFLL